MSHGVTTDVVKFQAYLGSDDQSEDSLLCMLCEANCWLDYQEEELEIESPALKVVHGWSCSDPMGGSIIDVVTFGKKGRMYGYLWSKGTSKVYCWNSSPDNNGGALEGAIAADDRESIETFVADFKDDLGLAGFAGTIQEDDTCEWWG